MDRMKFAAKWFYGNIHNDTTPENLENVYQQRLQDYQSDNAESPVLKSTGAILTRDEYIKEYYKNLFFGNPENPDEITIQDYDLVTETRFIQWELKKLTLYESYLTERQKKELDIYRDFVIEKQNKNKNQTTISDFQSTLNEPQLQILFNELLSAKFIHSQTDFKLFTAIFEAKPSTEPIKWIGSNRLLAYFFDCLFTREYINTDNWQSIIGKNKLFLNKSNKPITANDLAVAKNQYEALGNPNGVDLIDAIFKKLKTLIP
jgi:hypothetical protein